MHHDTLIEIQFVRDIRSQRNAFVISMICLRGDMFGWSYVLCRALTFVWRGNNMLDQPKWRYTSRCETGSLPESVEELNK